MIIFPDFVKASMPVRNILDRPEYERISKHRLSRLSEVLSKPEPVQGTNVSSMAKPVLTISDCDKPTILICSHQSRDSRCGALGPLLASQFRRVIKNSTDEALPLGPRKHFTPDKVNVGMISHVGGHIFAGNVIMYVPKTWQSPLAGYGIWYGRVEPKHVEGLVKETLSEGKIVQELFRGGINASGEALRLS